MYAYFLSPAYYVVELILAIKSYVCVLSFPYILLILSLNTQTKKTQKLT